MDTRKKLREANYFLGELVKHEQNPETFDFFMSAFLHAWRGVLDVMLHDFAEHYSLGFSREDELRFDNFKKAAKSKNCADGVRFIDWWLSKQIMLRSNPLWSKRNLSTHGGYLGMAEHVYYLSGSGATSGSISFYFAQTGVSAGSGGAIPVSSHAVIQPDYASKRLEFVDIPGIHAIEVCRNACSEMEKIVEEAERTFEVSL
jgi:hypothetical protein